MRLVDWRGVFVLTDALLMDEGDRDGAADVRPHGRLVRRIRCESGGGRVRLHIQPRFDYGLTSAHVRVLDVHTATAIGGADVVIVHSGIDLHQDDWDSCRGAVRLESGDERWVALSYQQAHEVDDALAIRSPDRPGLSADFEVTVTSAWIAMPTGAMRSLAVRKARSVTIGIDA